MTDTVYRIAKICLTLVLLIAVIGLFDAVFLYVEPWNFTGCRLSGDIIPHVDCPNTALYNILEFILFLPLMMFIVAPLIWLVPSLFWSTMFIASNTVLFMGVIVCPAIWLYLMIQDWWIGSIVQEWINRRDE